MPDVPYEEGPEQRQRRARTLLAIASTSFFTALGMPFIRIALGGIFDISSSVFLIITLYCWIQGAAALGLMYLRGDLHIALLDKFIANHEKTEASTSTSRLSQLEEWASFKKEIASLQSAVAAFSKGNNNTAGVDYDQLIKSVQNHVNKKLATELEARFAESAQMAAHVSAVRDAFEEASARLKQEIASLTRRGNLNLIIGGMTTAFAISLLAYMALWGHPLFESWPTLLSHYIPRIATAAFIEVFAFFFLRLYKNSLSEIRHYQTELTELAVRHIAFEAAHAINDPKSKALVVEKLAVNATKTEPSSLDSEVLKGSDLKDAGDLAERIVKLVIAADGRDKK